mmetsp:Transcript_20871/g.24833  ORF Transcript_20871/g.24833 Transcript_20871/m.24833 type:complete len:139 (+) Transcript_20871:52-468(+)
MTSSMKDIETGIPLTPLLPPNDGREIMTNARQFFKFGVGYGIITQLAGAGLLSLCLKWGNNSTTGQWLVSLLVWISMGVTRWRSYMLISDLRKYISHNSCYEEKESSPPSDVARAQDSAYICGIIVGAIIVIILSLLA